MGETYMCVAWLLGIFTILSLMCSIADGEIGLLVIAFPLLVLWTSPLIWKYLVMGWAHAWSM